MVTGPSVVASRAMVSLLRAGNRDISERQAVDVVTRDLGMQHTVREAELKSHQHSLL